MCRNTCCAACRYRLNWYLAEVWMCWCLENWSGEDSRFVQCWSAGAMQAGASLVSNAGRDEVTNITSTRHIPPTDELLPRSWVAHGVSSTPPCPILRRITQQEPIPAIHAGTRFCSSTPDRRKGTLLRCSSQDTHLHLIATGSGEQNGWPALCRPPGLPRLAIGQLTLEPSSPRLHSVGIWITRSL